MGIEHNKNKDLDVLSNILNETSFSSPSLSSSSAPPSTVPANLNNTDNSDLNSFLPIANKNEEEEKLEKEQSHNHPETTLNKTNTNEKEIDIDKWDEGGY